VSGANEGGAHRRFAVKAYRAGSEAQASDELAVESALEIRVEAEAAGRVERRSIVALRTPGSDVELAAGLLFTEGVVETPDEIEWIEQEGEAIVSVRVHVAAERMPEARTTFISSSCGACGKATIAALQARIRHPVRASVPSVAPETIHRLPESLRRAQPTFARTGGLHAAGLFDGRGELLALREDIGRHNALDKIIGAEFLAGRIPLADRIVLVSGRTGFEIAQKAAMAGVPVLASVGAPSSLAVEIARGCGLTLLGFVRDGRFNAYADFGRIASPVGEVALR
jgi:FdhD protein